MKKIYRPAGNSITLKHAPVDANLFNGQKYRFYRSGTASLAAAVVACNRLHKIPTSEPEIIIPAYACPDIISAVVNAGVRPVLVDLEEDSPCLSYTQLGKSRTANTIAVISVNFMGLQANLAKLESFCEDNNIFLIYDCAQWFPLDKEYAWPGDFNIVSFGRGKPVSLLQGGVVIINDPAAEKALPEPPENKISSIYNLVQACKTRAYNFLLHPLIYGFASRLPGLNVGRTLYRPLGEIEPMKSYYIGLIKTNIDVFRSQRSALTYLHKEIIEISHPLLTNLVAEELDAEPEYLLRYPILIKDKKIRDVFYEKTRDYGTSTLYRRPLNQIIGLENILDNTVIYTKASKFADHLVTLPCHADIDNKVVDIIVSQLRSVLDNCNA